MLENDVFTTYTTKHMDDNNLGVYSTLACTHIQIYMYSAPCTPCVLEKGTFYPNPLIQRYMERLYKLMYSDINLTNAPRRVPKGWTQIKCKLNVKQQHSKIIKLSASFNNAQTVLNLSER